MPRNGIGPQILTASWAVWRYRGREMTRNTRTLSNIVTNGRKIISQLLVTDSLKKMMAFGGWNVIFFERVEGQQAYSCFGNRWDNGAEMISVLLDWLMNEESNRTPSPWRGRGIGGSNRQIAPVKSTAVSLRRYRWTALLFAAFTGPCGFKQRLACRL